jgi:hypothetical protein
MIPLSEPFAYANDPTKAGKRASVAIRFASKINGREFAIFAVHTRFDAVSWLLVDCDNLDPANMPTIRRQADTFAEAMAGYSLDDFHVTNRAILRDAPKPRAPKLAKPGI